MGIDSDFGRAFAKSQLGAGVRLPQSGTVFVSVKDADKAAYIPICRKLAKWVSTFWPQAEPQKPC